MKRHKQNINWKWKPSLSCGLEWTSLNKKHPHPPWPLHSQWDNCIETRHAVVNHHTSYSPSFLLPVVSIIHVGGQAHSLLVRLLVVKHCAWQFLIYVHPSSSSPSSHATQYICLNLWPFITGSWFWWPVPDWVPTSARAGTVFACLW